MFKRLFIFMTGQPRCVQLALRYLIKNLVLENPDWDCVLFLGLDTKERMLPTIQFPGWVQMFQTRKDNLSDFNKGVQHLREKYSLSQEWLDYLVNRSGSILEYAQFSFLYNICRNQFPPKKGDLLLRMRTDVLLLTPWKLPENQASLLLMNPLQIVQMSFPKNFRKSEWTFESHREGCILPNPKKHEKWAIVLRKNLIYLMPYNQGYLIQDVVLRYGNWDSSNENPWWFNAESQFRGCLRQNQFTVFDISQEKDECYADFMSSCFEFPLYAIQRNHLAK